jgi:hypothetical protein
MYIPGYIILKSTFLMEGIAYMSKSLNAKDCSMNNDVYPRIHYPEVYILIVDIADMCKSLEAKEPSMNKHVYFRRHYPEVYIPDGGYCKYV